MSDLAGLGRLHAPDPRDRDYLLAKPRAAAAITSKYWMSLGPPLDQGGTSQCVIYAGDKYLTTHPILNKSFGTDEDRTRVYKQVQMVDEWEGEDYDGTSVRALFKFLKASGYVSEYRWAFDAETVIAHVLARGPVVMGTSWTMEMFMPDRWGYITDDGEIVGGHAWTIIGANRKKKNPDGSAGAVRMVNSWGSSWGDQNGKAWLTFATLERLVLADGEAAVGIEIKRPAA